MTGLYAMRRKRKKIKKSIDTEQSIHAMNVPDIVVFDIVVLDIVDLDIDVLDTVVLT
jgi:hypothetical protein